jgi:hypothetical protein
MRDNEWIEIAYVFGQIPTEESLQKLLAAFEPNLKPESADDEITNSYYRDTEYIDHYSRTISAAIRNNESCQVEIPFRGFNPYLGTGSSLLSTVPHISVSETIHPFTDPDTDDYLAEVRQRRQTFIDILARTAEILDPKWGFGRKGGLAIGTHDSVEGLAETTNPPLYEYNVFRRETVDHIGRDRVLSAPAWHVEELDTGGVFLVVGEPPMHYRSLVEEREAVADHLGLSVAETTKYYPDE